MELKLASYRAPWDYQLHRCCDPLLFSLLVKCDLSLTEKYAETGLKVNTAYKCFFFF